MCVTCGCGGKKAKIEELDQTRIHGADQQKEADKANLRKERKANTK